MAVATAYEGATSVLAGLARLSTVRQVTLLAVVAGTVALGVGVALWSNAPRYVPLYEGDADHDARGVLEALQEGGIPFRVARDTGAILVPATRLPDARRRLAVAGLPKDSERGFEGLSQGQSFGTSEFVERARYQHALEVELARTVEGLSNISAARVHLAIPRHSPFLRQRRPPSASVLVRLAPGRELADGQAAAITHLVAAAIPGLEPEQVRLVDQGGQLLSETRDADGFAVSRREFERLRRVESAYAERIEAILTPVVGEGGVRAEVSAELDFAPLPRGGGSPEVPAAEAARPTPAAVAPTDPSDPAPPPLAAPLGEVGEVPAPPAAGRVRRLTVAVVVDHRRATGDDGASVATPRTPEEMARLTSLVEDAIGFDPGRGDSVHVVNEPFTRPAPAPSGPPLWQRPVVVDLGRQLGGALLVVALVFGLLRPLACALVAGDAAEREPVRRPSGSARVGPDRGAPMALADGEGSTAFADVDAQAHRVEAVRALVHDDPRRVANVLRNWVREDA